MKWTMDTVPLFLYCYCIVILGCIVHCFTIFMLRLEAYRTRLVCWLVCWLVCLQNNFRCGVDTMNGVLKTRFQPETQTNKHQTKLLQFKNKQFLLIYSYPLSNPGAMARTSSAEIPGKHADVVLVQLVLIQLAKCSPFPSNGFPGW